LLLVLGLLSLLIQVKTILSSSFGIILKCNFEFSYRLPRLHCAIGSCLVSSALVSGSVCLAWR
jgi:hypothetical protein